MLIAWGRSGRVRRRLTSCATPWLLIQFHLQSSPHTVSPHFLTDEGQSSHSFPWWTESTLTELSPSRAEGGSARRAHGGKMAVVNMLTRFLFSGARWVWDGPGERISLAVEPSSHRSREGKWWRLTRHLRWKNEDVAHKKDKDYQWTASSGSLKLTNWNF